jgi:hypothetical protein
MRLTRLLPLLACLWAATAVAGDPALTQGAERLDAPLDERVARSYVPSAERRVGEVRLIRRGDANVVQTLLYTKLLRRVVGEIRQKELENWPEGPGRADALRYVEALSAVQQQIWGRLLASEPVRDRRQKLWIEFVLTPDASQVSIGAFEMDEAGGEVRVLRREALALLEASRAYVLRNMRLIAADSFRVEGAALRSLLEPLELLRGVGDESGG